MADNQNGQEPTTQEPAQEPAQVPQIDYDKIQKMLDGTLKAKEETALKAYFKQQGMTQEQVTQAIADFKEKQHTPDVAQLQADAENAKAELAQARIEIAAMGMTSELGIDPKSIGYILKLADLTGVVDGDGKIVEKNLKESIGKILNDVPAFKDQAPAQTGFRPQVGVSTGGGAGNQQTQAQKPKTATKRWNRFNY